MNKIILTLAAVMTMSFAACAQNNKREKNMQTEKKPLVVYFSATGTTARAARMIADVTGGTLCEIVPQQTYTSDDLDWNDKQSRSSVEMNNPDARPAVKDTKIDFAAYDVIFIGYPIWWNQAPRIINTFIESHDLKGKTLVPFATSGGSGINNSSKINVAELYHDCGNHSVLRGIPDFCQSGCRHYLWPHRPAYQTDRQKGVRA